MSAKSNEMREKLSTILSTPWNTRDGRMVPKTGDVSATDGAVKLIATYLYADLADSTVLAKRFKPEFTGKVIRMYLRAAVDMIRYRGGHIRSFDGDRVMGIFIGDAQRNDAVTAALNISWLLNRDINDLLKKHLEKSTSQWTCTHAIGIDHGEAFLVRGGARDNSDLVSIGQAPNIAAKLSAMRGEASPIIVTDRVYGALNEKQKLSQGRSMWDEPKTRNVGPHIISTYRSGWMRQP